MSESIWLTPRRGEISAHAQRLSSSRRSRPSSTAWLNQGRTEADQQAQGTPQLHLVSGFLIEVNESLNRFLRRKDFYGLQQVGLRAFAVTQLLVANRGHLAEDAGSLRERARVGAGLEDLEELLPIAPFAQHLAEAVADPLGAPDRS